MVGSASLPIRRGALATLAVATLAMAATGCGGDRSESPTASAREPSSRPAGISAAPAQSAVPSVIAAATPRRPRRSAAPAATRVASSEPTAETDRPSADPPRKNSTSRAREPKRRRRSRSRRAAPSPELRFIAAADSACARYQEREAAARRDNDGSKPAQIRYLDTVAGLLEEIARDIRALGPAPRAPETVARYVSVIERLGGEVREMRDATESFDASYSAKASQVAKSSDEAKRIARDYGFRICGSK